MTRNAEGTAPAGEARVIIIAEDEGDIFCLTDDDGAPRLFPPDDPEIPEAIEEARKVYGADARTVSIAEFNSLAAD